MPFLEVSLKATYQSANVANVFHYYTASTSPSNTLSEALNNGLSTMEPITGVVGLDEALARWQHLQVSYVEYSTFDIHNDLDFHALGITNSGAHSTSQSLPRFVCASFRSTKKTRAIRRGFKRFAGLSEDLVTGTIYNTGSALYTPLVETQQYLEATVTGSDGTNNYTFVPVVLGRRPPDVAAGRNYYSLYPTESEQLNHYFIADQWQLQANVTTQNSRKL